KPEELVEDLKDILQSAESFLPKGRKLKTMRKVLRQVKLFGFHLATLDIRNHSGEHEDAVGELLRTVKIEKDYDQLAEEDRQELLLELLEDPRPILLANQSYSESTENTLGVFKMIQRAHKEFGKRAIQVYIVSMTESPSDLLEVLLLAKETGIYQLLPDGQVKSNLDIVPLLETIEDLVQGSETMDQLFKFKVYQSQIEARGHKQE